MEISDEERVAFFKELQLFHSYEEKKLASLAKRAGEFNLAKDEAIFSAGDDGEILYFIFSGHVRIWQSQDGDDEIDELVVLEQGDYFGESALLYNHSRSVSASGAEESVILYFDHDDFVWMLNTFENLRKDLVQSAGTYHQVRRQKLDWLGEGEVVYLIDKRHGIEFIKDLIRPFIFLMIAVTTLWISIYLNSAATRLLLQLIGGASIGAAVALGIWDLIDWRNDLFIVTNQRVVWLEKIILTSNTRQEAPLSTIQSVNVRTSLIGRWFNFGDVIVRTYTGNLTMTNVKNPKHMEELVNELIKRVRRRGDSSKIESIRYAIREKLGYVAEDEDPFEPDEISLGPDETSKRGPLKLLQTREMHNGVFTYHKHWYAFFRKAALYIIGLSGLVLVGLFLLWMNISVGDFLSPLATITVGFFISLYPFVAIIYHYMDWRNDLYLLSEDQIIDREKKPFSTETTNSAPLKNVLSLQNERRGILGIILNIGTVTINVGDHTLTFSDVPNPAQIQQDIFYQMEKLKQKEAANEQERENTQMLDWLNTYHEVQQTQAFQEREAQQDVDEEDNSS